MKRFFPAFAVALLVVASLASPAFAARIRLSASASQRSVQTVVFTAKASRKARVRVTVYRGHRKVRALSASRTGSNYTAAWTGSTVQEGVYTYSVTAIASARRVSTRGKVTVSSGGSASSGGSGSGSTTGTGTGTGGKGRWIGLYVPYSPSDMSVLQAAEAVDGTHTAVVNFFVSDSESFPLPRCQNCAAHGSIPLITLEFWSIGSTGLDQINSGAKDAYIKKFADAAKSYGGEVWLRPFHEMNGDWYPWGATVGSNSAAKLVAAYRHVHDLFAGEGATNVKFVWCPNNDSCPNTSANSISACWPGDSYVDYAAIDGYNAGDTQSWSTWRSFASCFSSSYATITSLTSKPMIIAETSSVESGGSKAKWISDMFSVIGSSFPHIVGVCWFDANQSSDWRIDSTSTAATAFRKAVALGY